MNRKRYWLKLLLNIAIITLEALIIYSGYMLFTHKWEPVQGTLLFLGTIAFLVFSWKMANSRWSRWQSPRLAKTTLVVLGIVIICTFAGIEPLASYKNNLFTSWQTRQVEWEKAKAEEPSTERTLWQPPKVVLREIPDIEKDERETFNWINQDRIKIGLPPISWSDNLHDGARDWSEHLQSGGKLYHDTSGNFAECCYGASYTSYRTPLQIVEAWMSSDKHKAILRGEYSFGAVGIAKGNGFFATYRCY